jgi:hypothetical protein
VTTYRPGGARIVAYGVAVAIVVVTAAIAVALPDWVTMAPVEQVTLGLIGLGALAALHAIGRSYVRVEEEGLTVVNGFRRHQIAWTEIRAIAMKRGAPWPTLLMKGVDERQIILFAIQGSDGEVARRAAADLAKRVR